MPADSIRWYDTHAASLASRYEAVRPTELHGWLGALLSAAPGSLALDVGAGTGRDAAWLTSQGFDAVAVEPSTGMRREAETLHPDPRIRWLDDRLPALPATLRLGFAFNFVLLSAVWQHVPPAERARAFRKIVSLLKPGGLLAITLRYGPSPPEAAMHQVSLEEVEGLARSYGMMVVRVEELRDQRGRPDVHWTGVALRLPDDGTGALPLLRHLILDDQKSATYKLGLLRVICRAADGSTGLAQDAGDDHVLLPLGLVALNWLRLYLPLVERSLPQRPTNAGPDGLGFANAGFRSLLGGLVSRMDLRVGGRFSGDVAIAVHAALQAAADTIARMPANFMTYPNGGPILPAERRRGEKITGSGVILDQNYLAGFGSLRVPVDLWRALRRFAAWVEPALIAEWTRLMRSYAERQGRTLDEAVVAAAMTWLEPSRDVALPRELALTQLGAGQPLYCVWSGRRLDPRSLDIDHCIPWSAWACSDLWNLLPAHRAVNQRQKRDRLPSDERLRSAREAILTWWNGAYLRDNAALLSRRFLNEASASLPGLASAEAIIPGDVFDGMRLQQLRLRADQQVPEWPI